MVESRPWKAEGHDWSPSDSADGSQESRAESAVKLAAELVALGGAALALVYVVGGAILWLRLQHAGLPGEPVIGHLPREFLITVGLATVVLPLLVSLIVVVALYLTPPEFGLYPELDADELRTLDERLLLKGLIVLGSMTLSLPFFFRDQWGWGFLAFVCALIGLVVVVLLNATIWSPLRDRQTWFTRFEREQTRLSANTLGAGSSRGSLPAVLHFLAPCLRGLTRRAVTHCSRLSCHRRKSGTLFGAGAGCAEMGFSLERQPTDSDIGESQHSAKQGTDHEPVIASFPLTQVESVFVGHPGDTTKALTSLPPCTKPDENGE